MESKEISFVVEQAIQKRFINMIDFAMAADDKDMIEYYNSLREGRNMKRKDGSPGKPVLGVNLSEFSPDIARLFCEFIYDDLAKREILPKSFHNDRCIAANKIGIIYPEILDMNLADFKKWLHNQTFHIIAKNGVVDSFCGELKRYLHDRTYKEDIFNADVWDLGWFHISKERMNPALIRRKIYFNKILNQQNKHLIMVYAEYKLNHTSLSVNNIVSTVNMLQMALNMVDKSYDAYTHDDGCELVDALKHHYTRKETLARRIMTLNPFTEFLLIHDYIKDSPIKQFSSMAATGEYQYKSTAPDKCIIMQIFNVLGKIKDIRLVIWFLITFNVGDRGSETCRVEWDCLEKRDGGYFIKLYSTKMRKDVYNSIPLALYEMIDEYRHTLPIGSQYLFPSTRKGKIVQRTTMVKKLCTAFKDFGVKNPDGSEYQFRPHSLRHLMAVRMREEDIPYQFIQEQLHHESPEMTLAYIEYMDRQKAAKIKKYYDSNGDESPISSSIKTDDDEEYARYMQKHINAQMLPNGVCARPIKLGRCKHGNECLFCGDFRTSVEDLPIHVDHYERVCQYLKIAKQNNWLPQIETNRKIKERLEMIIQVLEQQKGACNAS